MPFGITAGIGAIAGAVGSAFGGGSSQSSGYTLPENTALQMMRDFQTSLQNIQQQQQQNTQMLDIYNRRADVIYGALKGSLPNEDAMKSLQQSSTQIALMFGGNAAEAVRQGFLDKDSAEAANLIKKGAEGYQTYSQGFLDNLKTMESQDYVDPALKHQQEDQRRQLQQDLQRQGVSPAGQMAALNQFDRNSSDQLFSRSQDLKNQYSQRAQMAIGTAGNAFGQYASGISGAAGLQMQGQNQQYNQAMGQYGALTGALGAAQQGYGAMQGLATQNFNVGQSSLQTSRQLNADPQNAYNQIGQFKFSKNTLNAIGSGLPGFGPSFSEQTGGLVSGKGIGSIADYYAKKTSAEQSAAQAGTTTNYNIDRYRSAAPQQTQDTINRQQQIIQAAQIARAFS